MEFISFGRVRCPDNFYVRRRPYRLRGGHRSSAHQEGALDASRDLDRNVARTLVADLELPALYALANHAFQPIEMHLREAVQGGLP